MKRVLTMIMTINPQTVEVVETTTTTSNSFGLQVYGNRSLTYLAHEGQS